MNCARHLSNTAVCDRTAVSCYVVPWYVLYHLITAISTNNMLGLTSFSFLDIRNLSVTLS